MFINKFSAIIIGLILGVFICPINITQANNQDLNQNSGYIQKIIPFPNLDEKNNDLNYIDTRFCNNGFNQRELTMDLSIAARPGQEKEICIIHFNRNDEDIYLWGGFPDNAIEPNGNSNCSSDYGRENPFSRFITPFKEEYVKVPAKSYIIRKTSIKFPIGINGIQKGCFAYGVDPGKLEEGKSLLFIFRKTHKINIKIYGEPYSKLENIIYHIQKQKKIIYYFLFIIIIIFLIAEIKKNYIKSCFKNKNK